MSEPSENWGLHPLDQGVIFGYTGHGLVVQRPPTPEGWDGGPARVVDGRAFDLPHGYPAGSPVQIITKPGIAPIPLTEEALAEEREQGREWQNYSFLHGDAAPHLHGVPVGGWIYWDDAGAPWLIRHIARGTPAPSQGASAHPITMEFRYAPFGDMGVERVPFTSVTVDFADTSQRYLPADGNRNPSFVCANRRGSTAVFCFKWAVDQSALGYLAIDVTDINGAPALSGRVLRTQADTLREWVSDYEEDWREHLWRYHSYHLVGTVSSASGRFPTGLGSASFSASGVEVKSQSWDDVNGLTGSFVRVGTGTLTSERKGRLVHLCFDDRDELVEFRVDTQLTHHFDYPELDISAYGTSNGRPPDYPDGEPADGYRFSDGSWSGTWGAQISRAVTEAVTATVALYRDGDLMHRDIIKREVTCQQAISHSSTFDENSVVLGVPYEEPVIGQWVLSVPLIAAPYAVTPAVGVHTEYEGVYHQLAGWVTGELTATSTNPEHDRVFAESAHLWPDVIAPGQPRVLRYDRTVYALNTYPYPVPDADRDWSTGLGYTPWWGILRIDLIDSPSGRLAWAAPAIVATSANAPVRAVRDSQTFAAPAFVTEEQHICFAAADVTGRGAGSGGVAYHPVTHEIVTESPFGTPIVFI